MSEFVPCERCERVGVSCSSCASNRATIDELTARLEPFQVAAEKQSARLRPWRRFTSFWAIAAGLVIGAKIITDTGPGWLVTPAWVVALGGIIVSFPLLVFAINDWDS